MLWLTLASCRHHTQPSGNFRERWTDSGIRGPTLLHQQPPFRITKAWYRWSQCVVHNASCKKERGFELNQHLSLHTRNQYRINQEVCREVEHSNLSLRINNQVVQALQWGTSINMKIKSKTNLSHQWRQISSYFSSYIIDNIIIVNIIEDYLIIRVSPNRGSLSRNERVGWRTGKPQNWRPRSL